MAELSLRSGVGRNPPSESVQIAASTHGVVNGTGHTSPLETTRNLDNIYETGDSGQNRTIISERRK